MRRLMVSEFMSLDGIAEAPGGEPGHPNTGWVFPYHGDALLVYKAAEMREAGALLLGRVTYEGFAEAWPGRTGDIADQINGIPKYVASSTLRAPLDWKNSTLLEGDLVKSITSLKQQEGAPIMVHGSMALTQSLLAAILVDDLRLMIFPVTVGGGCSIYPDGFQQSSFTLTSVETVLPNVIALTYSRAA
jgi:dihydrofolate reductase